MTHRPARAILDMNKAPLIVTVVAWGRSIVSGVVRGRSVGVWGVVWGGVADLAGERKLRAY